MGKNLMSVLCVFAIFAIQLSFSAQINVSNNLEAHLSNSENDGLSAHQNKNRLLYILNIDQNDQQTTSDASSIENPFSGNNEQQNSNEKGKGTSLYSSNGKYTYSFLGVSGVAYLNEVNYRYLNGTIITNFIQIKGLCSPNSANLNSPNNFVFSPTITAYQTYLMPMGALSTVGMGFYQTFVPMGGYIFPYTDYHMAINGWCGYDTIGPVLHSTGTRFSIY